MIVPVSVGPVDESDLEQILAVLVIDWLWCNAIAVPEWIRFEEIARMFASSFMVFYSPFLFVSMDEWKEEGGEGEGRTWFVPSGGGHFGIHQVTTDRSDRNLSLPDRQLMNVSPILSLFISDFSYAVPFGALLSCHRDLEESLRILGESCTSQSWNLSICDNGWDDPEAHMDFFSLSLSLSSLLFFFFFFTGFLFHFRLLPVRCSELFRTLGHSAGRNWTRKRIIIHGFLEIRSGSSLIRSVLTFERPHATLSMIVITCAVVNSMAVI